MIRKILRLTKKANKYLYLFIALSFLLMIPNLYEPILIGKMFAAFATLNFDTVFQTIKIYIILYVIVIILENISMKAFINFRHKFYRAMQENIFDAFLNTKIKKVDILKSGEFLNRVEYDSDHLGRVLADVPNNTLLILKGIFSLAAMIIINYKLAAVVTTIVLINFIITIKLAKKEKKYVERESKEKELTSSAIKESYTGIREVKALGLKKYVRENYFESFASFQKTSYKIYNFFMLKNLNANISRVVLEICFFGIGAILVKNGELKIELLFAFRYYVQRVVVSIKILPGFSKQINESKNSASRIIEVIEEDKFEKEAFGNMQLENITGNIKIENLNFSYEKEEVLKDLNLNINKNEVTAIVGKSGGGKTTLFNLLLKLYDKKSGNIKFDGIDINEISEESLRKNISVIRQEPFLFNKTISENIRIVNEKLTNDDVVNYAKKAHIHDYIISLEDSYETIVGEGGVNLSGGQKQRIAIARALAKGSKIILFDEATSALDNEAQSKIKETIYELKENHTIMVIAHRLSTIMDADKIVVIEDGKVKSEGKHSELIKECSTYSELYNVVG